jgi:6-phosphogluconolactonase (cycloisomerase 2 family)
MSLKIKIFTILLLIFFSYSASAVNKTNRLVKPTDQLNTPTDANYLTANRIKIPIQNDAIFGQNPYTGRAGTEWPQGTGNMYIFGAGIWIGAQIPAGGEGLKKVVSVGYNPNDGYSEWGPGIIVSPDSANHGVTGPPPTYPILLSTEVGTWSHQDSLSWPLKDDSGNPKFVSTEDSWCFYNDADINYHDPFAVPGDQLNILVKQTTYAFNSRYDKDIIFMIWDIFNKGDQNLDSVYIGITVDPDLGNATDDMIGFDSTRNFCWVYNYNLLFDQDISGVPGMMGFRFLESPEDPTGNPLGLTSLTLFTIDTDPANDVERYNLMAGLTTSGSPRPGGPFDKDTSPQDKRFCQGTGPFNLLAGDSIRVVFGVVAGQSESLLKANSDYALALYEANFAYFTLPVNYAAGDGPISVFSADLDGDQDLDLAVANFYSNNISIFKNNGNGTFQTAVNYGTGHYPVSVFCADLDGDKDLDMAVANYLSNTVSILKNNGDGTFQSKVDYAAGSYPTSVFCADLDGDLDLDLTVANFANDNVSILKNNGDGTFQPKVDYAAGDGPQSIFCADLDDDLDLDLAVANYLGDNVSILKNNGDGTFQPEVDYVAGDYPASVFCADLDGDKDLDMAVANYLSNTVSILKNNGDGTFQPEVDYAAGDGPTSVFCADLDGDGYKDLAVANFGNDNVSVLKNNGYATFQTKTDYPAGDGPQSVFSADLDGDLDLDLAVANFNSDDVSVLLNLSNIPGYIAGDVNGDGSVSLSDIVYLINYLFKFGPAPVPSQAGNTNCDSKTSLSDIVYLINYLFKSGSPPCK